MNAVAETWSDNTNVPELKLHPEDFPEFYFKIQKGSITHNHQPYWLTDDDKYCFHCLFYIQRRHEASVCQLKQLIERLCLKIVVTMAELIELVDYGQNDERIVCHLSQHELEDDHGNIVRCILKYYLPRNTPQVQWFNYIKPIFQWMGSYAYSIEESIPRKGKKNRKADCIPVCFRQTQEHADRSPELVCHRSHSRPGVRMLF